MILEPLDLVGIAVAVLVANLVATVLAQVAITRWLMPEPAMEDLDDLEAALGMGDNPLDGDARDAWDAWDVADGGPGPGELQAGTHEDDWDEQVIDRSDRPADNSDLGIVGVDDGRA